MSDSTYSSVYDTNSAAAMFPGIGTRDLVLSLLAGIAPETAWSGCRVFEGETPLDADTVCIAMAGPGADAVQLRLVEAFERTGIEVIAVYEGGPAPHVSVARADNGLWDTPDR